MAEYLYQQLENRFREEIQSGQRAVGSRMPSVRQLCADQHLSKSTVLTAYARLEAEGWIEARVRSGYFVASTATQNMTLKPPATSQPEPLPSLVSSGEVLLDIMQRGAAFDLLPGGEQHQGNEQLRRCLGRCQRSQSAEQQRYYDEPMGLPELRQQLVRRVAQGGSTVSEDDLVVTSGCQHGLLMALMATTQPGDVVAVESPGFYGIFQLLETLGLRALELPSSSETGVSPEAFKLALQHWDIKTLVTSPSFATPTGAVMPEQHKQQLLELAIQHEVAIIEDDIYGDLHFGLQRPRTLQSYDDSGSVILCSSFSKSLSRDLRLGWMVPGKYLDQVKRLKFVTAIATSQTLQQGVALFLEQGGYDKHLRLQRMLLRTQCLQLRTLIQEHLPMAMGCSLPEGGLTVWLELPDKVDTIALYSLVRKHGIVLTPGPLFTSQPRYQNFLRLSFAHEWTPERIAALEKVGKLIQTI